jgi:hypothetical protein
MFAVEQTPEAAMVVEVEPIKVDNSYFINVIIDGIATSAPRGPYADADTAESTAAKMRKIGRALASPSEW